MNNQSPLVPQGTLLDQKNKGRARVKIAVFFVLAIHGIGLLALLMQGCRREPAAQVETTNTPPSLEATNVVADTNPPAPPTNPATVIDNTPPPGAGTDYVIAAGDNFSALSKKFGVPVKAILDANPGVDPTKLKIGQKVHIPAATASTPAVTGAAPVAANGEQIYTVKSGDTLGAIAKNYGTTVKALRSLNSLKTDNIKVGQKLKIPAKASSPAPGATTTPDPAPATPAPTTTTPPQAR